MEYKLVVADSPKEFDRLCSELAKDGWVWQGGLSVITYSTEKLQVFRYIQQWYKHTPT